MATTSYSAFEAGKPPLSSIIGEMSDELTEEGPSSSGRVEVEECSAVGSLCAQGREVQRRWKACGAEAQSVVLTAKWKEANRTIVDACSALLKSASAHSKTASGWLIDNSSLFYQALDEARTALKTKRELPQVLDQNEQAVPRVYAATDSFLDIVRFNLQAASLVTFFNAIQEDAVFADAELSLLRPCFQLALLERVGSYAKAVLSEELSYADANSEDGLLLVECLRTVAKIDWDAVFDTLSKTDHILRQDPAGAYAGMDADSRKRYHSALADLAARSSRSEFEVAHEAIRLAQGPHDMADPRARERRSHVGYYLVDAGQRTIKQAIGYEAPLAERIQAALRNWPTVFYLSTIALATCGIFGAVFAGAGGSALSVGRLAIIFLIALVPVVECAIAVTNLLVTHLIKPERLPRLDFSAGIPEECATLVATPILLVSDKQIRQSVRDLEIRYLANRDRNLHFALVTDAPDSLHQFDEKDALSGLCSSLIEELNEKYGRREAGSFIHLHRNRAYNEAEGIWMGWERKRGKMLDLNNFLLDGTDHFPVKAGNVAVLKKIRFVITLDQDTQLLTESGRKLVGALAHPLNRAVVDPTTNRVVEGYAILQPKVTISVKAAGRSRLASIFSGDSGFDVYTRAVSDVYQDLFGAGIYTGKGIYEVETFQRLLEHRFPANVILSHDLIEGAHARAGFISDIELVDDYPSHVSAYSRRKHRWVRGDWQIILWLFPRVPDSRGNLVANPLSVISRWQIVDNLRRSLSEVATFALLVCGWLFWPQQAIFWTLTAVLLTAAPICLDFFVSLLTAGRSLFTLSFWRNAASDLAGRFAMLLCRMALLCHQGLVAVDAVGRTAVRMTVTHQRLLEWETAAQAEVKTNETSAVESYLNWTAPAAIVIAGAVARFSPSALWVALPFLMLWGTSKGFCDWLSVPYPKWNSGIDADDQAVVRHMSLRTWRFFREFCTEEENWLIPDVVQVEPAITLHEASTTNLGLLVNAQLAAHDLGFLTLSDFVTAAERTMGTIGKLPTYKGQFYNWYDTRTLEPKGDRFISTVDNGNFVCCLWTLKGACAELKSEPIFPGALREGFSSYLDAIEDCLPADPRSETARTGVRELRRRMEFLGSSDSEWFKMLSRMAAKIASVEQGISCWAPESEAAWWARALCGQIRSVEDIVHDFVPWLAPEFAELRSGLSILSGLPGAGELTLEELPALLNNVRCELAVAFGEKQIKDAVRPLANCLLEAISRSLAVCQNMLNRISTLGSLADHLANAQDFAALYSPQRELLSIGYDADKERLWEYHYDLLASEARSAAFIAIAKGDVSQEVWFRMGRGMALVNDRTAVLSWSGTMFEYLMPSLWMKLYPNTLLEQAARTALATQRKYVAEKQVPWGMSECSFAEKCPNGRYGYRAFGVPQLALSRMDPKDVVISPYSSFLALLLDAPACVSNLREMHQRGWLGTYGFYDACDFTQYGARTDKPYEMVACWMAHHQGMILVAASNALCANAMQRRFHAEPMVAATERLLQEVPRSAAAPVGDEPNTKLGWLKASVPVLRNLWQTALATPGVEPEVPVAQQVREIDG